MALNIPEEELNLVAEVENAIRDRLLQLAEIGAKVVVEPSTLSDQGKVQVAGRLTIACVDSQFSRPAPGMLTGGEQIEEMHLQLDWKLRDLRTHQEAWRVIRAIWVLLSGWQPHHCTESGLDLHDVWIEI
jgi:hypothetical protein